MKHIHWTVSLNLLSLFTIYKLDILFNPYLSGCFITENRGCAKYCFELKIVPSCAKNKDKSELIDCKFLLKQVYIIPMIKLTTKV